MTTPTRSIALSKANDPLLWTAALAHEILSAVADFTEWDNISSKRIFSIMVMSIEGSRYGHVTETDVENALSWLVEQGLLIPDTSDLTREDLRDPDRMAAGTTYMLSDKGLFMALLSQWNARVQFNK